MIFRAKITHSTAGDYILPLWNFDGRQRSGRRSSWRATCSLRHAEEIDARISGGRLVVEIVRPGEEDWELFDDPIQGVTPSYGVQSRSISISAAGQTTWTPPAEAAAIPAPYYRGPNRTDGRWTYQYARPLLFLRPGYSVDYDGHVWTVGEILWNVRPVGMMFQLSEAEA